MNDSIEIKECLYLIWSFTAQSTLIKAFFFFFFFCGGGGGGGVVLGNGSVL